MAKVAPGKSQNSKQTSGQTEPPNHAHHLHGLETDTEMTSSASTMTSLETEMARKYGHNLAKKPEDIKHMDPHERRKKVLSNLSKFWRTFSAVFFSPIFLRHRNLFFLFIEVIAPGLVTMVIFAAFTSGISWKQAQHSQNQAYNKLLNYPEVTMQDTMRIFKEGHTDSQGRTLILFTPVNDITSQIMQHTLEHLQLENQNRLHRRGQSSTGFVGISSELELIERAMFHRKDTISHGTPVAVVFKIDNNDRSNITNFPFDVTFSISLFDEAISYTIDNFPFVEPADTENWVSPYITSGFIGLQYAIEESVIRLILEKQREVEVKELELEKDDISDSQARGAPMGIDVLIDEDLFDFLKEETAMSQENDDNHNDEGFEDDDENSGPKGRSSSESDHMDHVKNNGIPMMHRRIIKTAQELPERSLKMFSYNMFGTEDYRQLITVVVTFSLVASYTFMSFFIVKQIAVENFSGIKDLLQMHGLPHYIHWLMLLLHALIFRAITSFMVLFALRMNLGNGSIIKVSSKSVLYTLIYVHQLSLTFMNYFIAIYVKNPKLCGVISITFGVFSFYLPETFAERKLVPEYTDFLLAVVFPNWCIRQVMRCLIDHEIDEKGISWGNLFDIAYVNLNPISVGGGLIRLILIGVLYFSLAAYIDMTTAAKLFPQTFKWYQFKEKSKQKKEGMALHDKLVQDIDEGLGNVFEKPPVYEEPKPELKCFIHIRNICKSYGKYKVALDSINMNIMHEEVTVILGHSGCGKSTLISILAGLVSPTNGYAVVKGFDVQYDKAKAREYIGMCPQKLVAFNLLTVREHVRLCYLLKGYKSSECDQQVASLLTKLRLWNARSFLPSNLTSDELRRLGMAMALADTPKVLLLDEPTRGMDSMGRKEIWDIINTLKRHHTIVLTTNYMDEAEHLADRLAFISHGRLICYGTMNFLRSQYDTGYYLKIHPYPLSPFLLNKERILDIVREQLGEDAYMKVYPHKRLKDVDDLVIGLSVDDKDKFPDLCDELEKNMTALNISHYSVRRVSLNDVFIRLCSSVLVEAHTLDLYTRRDSGGDIKSILFSEVPRLHENEIPEGINSETEKDDDDDEENIAKPKGMTIKDYFNALLKKRWAVIKSGGYTIAFHFVVPLIFMWMVVFQAKSFVQGTSQNQEREMNIKEFARSNELEFFYRIGQDDMAINYSGHIGRILGPIGRELNKTERVITKMYEVLKTDESKIGYIKDDHMAAFEFRKLGKKSYDPYDFVGYFASGALHSPAITVNLMSNVYLSVISSAEWPTGRVGRPYTVTTRNNPMPMTKKGKFEDGCGITCTLLALIMSFSIAFVSHFCVLLPLMERETGMKHLQLMCGVPPPIYWVADYAVDVVIMFAISFIIVIIFLADLSQTFHSTAVIFSLWLLCQLYLMWSGLMYAYFMSTIIPKSMNGDNVLALLHLFLGIIPMLWLTESPPTDAGGIFWRNFLELMLPPYTITVTFYNFFDIAGQRNICNGINPFLKEICDVRNNPHNHTVHTGHYLSERLLYEEIKRVDEELDKCCDRTCMPKKSCFTPPSLFNSSNESWEYPGLIANTVALVLQGFIYCALLIISDKKIIQRMVQKMVLEFLKSKEKNATTVPKRFRDVRHESLTVHSILEDGMPDDTAMVCANLTKSTTSKMIIKDFCLEVKKGQCIAILGRGNSGKTVLAKMIAGELIPTRGNCHIKQKNLIHNRKSYLSRIGYCPQRNCVYSELTGAQMVELMGRLRNIAPNILNTHVDKWLRVMGLSDVANDKCKEYGDGIKQKLRTCMAFIGEPEIILLDEPTAVADPLSKERIWAVVEHLNAIGHTILITTSDTEEAFSLAQKVVVIADGSVQCIGDPEKLQRAYGRGHTLIFKVKHRVLSTAEIISVTEGRVSAFKTHVEQTYRHIDLIDEQDEIIMFFLRDGRLSWAEVFRRAQYLSSVHSDIIEYYEVSEGEVDDIFVYLTNKFHELGKPRKSDPPEFVTISKKDAELKDLKDAEEHLKNKGF